MKGKRLFLFTLLLLCISGGVFAQKDSAHRNFSVVTTQEPEYPGGNKALYTFFYEEMEYPEEAYENKIEGDVYLSFYVEPDSSVSDVVAMNDLGYGTKEEAIRLINLCKFVPGKQNGRAIRMNLMVPVLFRIYE